MREYGVYSRGEAETVAAFAAKLQSKVAGVGASGGHAEAKQHAVFDPPVITFVTGTDKYGPPRGVLNIGWERVAKPVFLFPIKHERGSDPGLQKRAYRSLMSE